MAVIDNTRLYVQAPTPIVSRYGLFQVATGPLALPVHARTGGLEYELGTCVAPYSYDTNCDADELEEKTFSDEAISVIEGDPFVVIASLTCGSLGLPEDRYRTLLMDQLRANEQGTVEDRFSRDLSAATPDHATLTASTTMTAAFAQMEHWLYTTNGYGIPGVIHVPALAAAAVMNSILVWKDGPVWRTGLGTAVSFGNYAGLKADGTSPASGHTTLWVSGPVTVWRTPDSDVFMTPIEGALNRATNQISAFVEREYIVTFDCFAAAVDVTL